MCLSSEPSKPSRSIREIEADDEAFLGAIDSDKAWETRVFLAGVPLTMKIHTGADVTAIPDTIYMSALQSSPPLSRGTRLLRGPDGRTLDVAGFPLTHLIGLFFFSAHGLRGSWPQGPSSRMTYDYSPTCLADAWCR